MKLLKGATVHRFPIYVALVVMIAGASSCARTSQTLPAENGHTMGAANAVLTDHVSEQERLSQLERKLELYSEDTEAGRNFRRKMSGYTRDYVFHRAFVAYWMVNNHLPYGESVEDVIDELQSNYLIPFWPADPVTGRRMGIVDNPGDISEWGDVYIEIAANGAFDYYTLSFEAEEPFYPYVSAQYPSVVFDSMNRVMEPPDEADDVGTFEKATDPSEVFADLIVAWYQPLITESFLSRNGEIPLTLEELLMDRVCINEVGWGHPVGALQDGETGNFECGVDPDLNGYYWEIDTEQGWKTLIVRKFVQTELDGKLVYDTSICPGGTLARLAGDQELTHRIPLLTDELFAGDPPPN